MVLRTEREGKAFCDHVLTLTASVLSTVCTAASPSSVTAVSRRGSWPCVTFQHSHVFIPILCQTHKPQVQCGSRLPFPINLFEPTIRRNRTYDSSSFYHPPFMRTLQLALHPRLLATLLVQLPVLMLSLMSIAILPPGFATFDSIAAYTFASRLTKATEKMGKRSSPRPRIPLHLSSFSLTLSYH